MITTLFVHQLCRIVVAFLLPWCSLAGCLIAWHDRSMFHAGGFQSPGRKACITPPGHILLQRANGVSCSLRVAAACERTVQTKANR